MTRKVILDLRDPQFSLKYNALVAKSNHILACVRRGEITAATLTDEHRQIVADAMGNTLEFDNPGLTENMHVTQLIEGRDYAWGTGESGFSLYVIDAPNFVAWSPGTSAENPKPKLTWWENWFANCQHLSAFTRLGEV